MLISLVLTVCLQSDAATCREELIEYKGAPMACVTDAPVVVAEWGTDHPEWRIASWKCRSSG